MKKRTKMYLHSNKDDNWEKAQALGLEGEAVRHFRYALNEVEFELDVDMTTGEIEVLSADVGGKVLK